MLVFRPVSLLEKLDEKALSFSFEDDIDYQDDDGSDEPESKFSQINQKPNKSFFFLITLFC